MCVSAKVKENEDLGFFFTRTQDKMLSPST